ncbi:MAG TPA: ORF6N domain-containing protein [Ignavibacteriaceae bacterium]|nr:ORF6N domain-containing protein [Ignavibacteriaceae bacterium]
MEKIIMKKSKDSLILYDSKAIQQKIYTIRDVQVMLDRDLAKLYQVKAIRLREQVKRNHKRFPIDFMFQLTKDEVDFMVSQNAIPSKKHLGGYLPYVFTEQGVANLSSVLKSERAIETNINIMRAFVAMRKFIINNAQLFQRIDTVEKRQLKHEMETDEKFEKVFDALQKDKLDPKQGIFFDGQIFDAHKFVSDLIRKAEKSILLIDNYVDDSVLTLFTKRKKDVTVTIYTANLSKVLITDLKKFNAQYPKIEVKEFKQSHDRFMIIDDEDVYHFGASLKDIGKKWFAFSKFEKEALKILDKLNKMGTDE